jgi:hypothetical protein
MRYTALLMMLMFLAVTVDAETGAEERYVAALDVSGISFIYNAKTSSIILISTTDTEEKVAEFEQKKPIGVDVTVITYQGKGKLGYEIGLEEGAELD